MMIESSTNVVDQASLSIATRFSGESKDPFELAVHLADGLIDAGLPVRIERNEGWILLTLVTDEGLKSLAVMEAEVTGLDCSALSVRLGVSLGYGIPSGEVLTGKPDTFFYVPSTYTVGDLLALCCGHLSPVEFTALLNFSARYSMSVPRERFPTSILIMISERTELYRVGAKHFELWTQSSAGVQIIKLKPTSNPHEAATEAASLGFSPTIYRCQSGALIPFKTTHGGVFL